MPLSEIHKRKKYKNYLVFSLLLFLVIIFFIITILKVSL